MRTQHQRSPQDYIASSLPAAPGTETLSHVESRLERSGYSALQRVRCELRDGVLRLRGQLPSQYLKQIALAVVAKSEGVQAIVNEIEVVRPPANGQAAERFAWAEAARIEHRPFSSL